MNEYEKLEKELRELAENCSYFIGNDANVAGFTKAADAISYLSAELQQYRAIGTIEECREAMEIMKILKSSYPWIVFTCDHCGTIFVKPKRHRCPKCCEEVSWAVVPNENLSPR